MQDVCNQTTRSLKMTQPVLIQGFEDEFEILGGNHLVIPAVPGSILTWPEKQTDVIKKMKYHSGIGKLLHLIQWTWPELYKVVWQQSFHTTMASEIDFMVM